MSIEREDLREWSTVKAGDLVYFSGQYGIVTTVYRPVDGSYWICVMYTPRGSFRKYTSVYAYSGVHICRSA